MGSKRLPGKVMSKVNNENTVLDFLKLQTVVESDKSTLSHFSNSLKVLTDTEGLPNHYKAVKRRLE